MAFTLAVLALFLPWAAAECSSSTATCPAAEVQDHDILGASSLMQHQVGLDLLSGDPARHRHAENENICVPLDNHGVYFSMPLRFGSNAQKVDLIVDTGSTVLVVADCFCKSCNVAKDQCVDTAQSTSYKQTCAEDEQGADKPIAMSITYASGAINGYAADEKVRVGSIEQEMKMMLVRTAELSFNTFQGIVGLGLPTNRTRLVQMINRAEAAVAKMATEATHEPKHAKAKHEAAKKVGKVKRGHLHKAKQGEMNISKATQQGNLSCGTTLFAAGEDHDEVNLMMNGAVDGLLTQLQATRFSVCFKSQGEPGVLRINQKKAHADKSLKNIGTEHWGLGLHGFSLDGEPVDNLCRENVNGTATPCGFIPDSGTTMITAPMAQMVALKASLCRKWKLCRENIQASPMKDMGAMREMMESAMFDNLLLMCDDFLKDSKTSINDVLPSIEFLVSGKDGKNVTLTLPPFAYVASSLFKSNQTGNHTGKDMLVCQAMFKVYEYTTVTNGPVFIVGTPLFHQFTVGFEFDADEPEISFTSWDEEPCGQCGTALTATTAGTEVRHRVRMQEGEPLLPRIDTSRPL